jgi:hypothetical protein
MIDPKPEARDLTWEDVPVGTYFWATVGTRELKRGTERLYGRMWSEEKEYGQYTVEAFEVAEPGNTYTWDTRTVAIRITRVVSLMKVETECDD